MDGEIESMLREKAKALSEMEKLKREAEKLADDARKILLKLKPEHVLEDGTLTVKPKTEDPEKPKK